MSRTVSTVSDFNGDTASGGATARRLSTVAPALAAAVLVVVTVVGAARSWLRYDGLTHVGGAWATLAADLAAGEFYRPLVSELGYGGTRFMPLFFTIHAAIIRAGAAPIEAGLATSLLSVLFLLAGVHTLLRRSGTSAATAACATVGVLAAESARQAMGDVRGDALPLALNVWGLVLLAGARPRPVAAGVLFALAFAAKVTALYAVPVAAVYLFYAHGRTDAVRLVITAAIGTAGVLAGAEVASSGRFGQILAACAGGGTDLSYAARAPLWFLRIAAERDPVMLAVFAAAAACRLRDARRREIGLPALYFAGSLLATVAIYATRGTTENHLIDLHVAGVVAVAAGVGSTRRTPSASLRLLLAACFLAAAVAEVRGFFGRGAGRRADIEAALASAGTGDGPLLAQDPVVALAAGERPYLLDAFMFRVVTARDPTLAEPMWAMLDRRAFRAVVLKNDVNTPFGRELLTKTHFGPKFLDRLAANYRPVARHGKLHVYLPIREHGGAAAADGGNPSPAGDVPRE